MKDKIKFDICDYFNSKAIADHCRNIGEKLNLLESAYIIFHNDNTLIKKEEAYHYLMNNMEDMSLEASELPPAISSLKVKIKEMVKGQKEYIQWFKEPQDKWIYFWESKTKYESWYGKNKVYSSWENALEAIKEWYEDEEEKYYFRITKQKLNGIDKHIIVINGEFEIMDIGTSKSGTSRFNFLEDYPVRIPIPFKSGDLLVAGVGLQVSETEDKEFMISDINAGAKYIVEGHSGNSWATPYADICTLDYEGDFVYKRKRPIWNFEYYEGEIPETYKLLQVLSRGKKEKIYPDELSNAYLASRHYHKYLDYKEFLDYYWDDELKA